VPVLYIGRTVLKGQDASLHTPLECKPFQCFSEHSYSFSATQHGPLMSPSPCHLAAFVVAHEVSEAPSSRKA
jgi:hypothetical protein